MSAYQLFSLGDHAITLQIQGEVSIPANRKIMAMFQWLQQQIQSEILFGIKDIVPSYSTLTLVYDVYTIRKMGHPSAFTFCADWLHQAWASAEAVPRTTQEVKIIPVCYAPEFGVDQNAILEKTGLSREEMIKLHTGRIYQVFLLGFLPGFPYLGILPEALYMPRKETPARRIVPGSVGIAGWQTGIYPLESPGGWQIIGRTPVKIFDPQKTKPCLLEVGDQVRFESIDKYQFEEWDPFTTIPYEHQD